MSITYAFNPQGVTVCTNALGLTFYMIGQAPHPANRPLDRPVIGTGGLN